MYTSFYDLVNSLMGLKKLAPTVFTDLGEMRRQHEKTKLSTFEKCSSSLATNLPKCKQG